MTGGLAPCTHWLGCLFLYAKRFVQSAPRARTVPNPILSPGRPDPPQPPHNPSPFPLDPHSPSLLLALRHGLCKEPLHGLLPIPPTTIGAHRRWIRAGEEQLQLWWGASVPKMKEVRRPPLSPCCSLLPILLSPFTPSSATAGDKGKEQVEPTSSLCTRTRGAGSEGNRHGQRQRCTGTSASGFLSCLPIPFRLGVFFFLFA